MCACGPSRACTRVCVSAWDFGGDFRPLQLEKQRQIEPSHFLLSYSPRLAQFETGSGSLRNVNWNQWSWMLHCYNLTAADSFISFNRSLCVRADPVWLEFR